MGKNKGEKYHECEDESCEEDGLGLDDSLDVEEAVKDSIKQETDLTRKLQFIAINTHLLKKRELDDELDTALKFIEVQQVIKAQPILASISELVAGTRPILEEELSQATFTDLQHETKANYYSGRMNQYWLKCLQQSEISDIVFEADQPVLEKLTDIRCSITDDRDKLSLTFVFDQNQYFKNKEITKVFHLKDGQPVRSEAAVIEWKEGKNYTVKITKKKKKNKKVTKEVEQPSFFNLFKAADDETSQEKLTEQYEAMEFIFLELVPRSLQFFLGVAFDQFGEEQGEDFEDEDDSQDEEEQEKAKSKSKSKSKSKNKADKKGKRKQSTDGNTQGQPKPECKQQ